MFCLRRTFLILSVLLVSVPQYGQEKQSTTKAAPVKDVDPLALDVLRAVAQPVEQAQIFTFKALISEEELAINAQIVTFYRTVDVAVRRPDKVHLVYRGRGQRVDFYLSNGTVSMYAPDTKLYASVAAKPTIDAGVLDFLHKGFDMPIGPFLLSNFYDVAAKAVTTGYVVGRVKLFDQDVHQLAFTAPDADWQMWVTGGAEPRIVRVEVVNKKLQGKPRTTIQFLDWDLTPNLPGDEFTFTKPADAHEIGLLPGMGGK